MVESKFEEVKKAAEEAKSIGLGDTVNTPMMTHMNLSSVFLDPEIGKAFTLPKKEFNEDYMMRSGYWGDNNMIRNVDDLRLEMDNQAAKDEEDDDINIRDDSASDPDEDLIASNVFTGRKGKAAAAEETGPGGISVAEMKEIIDQ